MYGNKEERWGEDICVGILPHQVSLTTLTLRGLEFQSVRRTCRLGRYTSTNKRVDDGVSFLYVGNRKGALLWEWSIMHFGQRYTQWQIINR